MDLRKIVEETGVSITDFAKLARVTRKTIYNWFDRPEIDQTNHIHTINATLKLIEENKKLEARGGKHGAK